MHVRTRVAVAATGIGAALLGTLGVAAAPAHAAPTEQVVGMRCYGTNPNILLFPFYGGATIAANTPGPGQFTITSDSKDAIPYTTDTTVRVTELRTHRTQTFHRRWEHSFSDASGYQISGIRARGPVRVTISAVNRGLFQTLTGPTCTGTVNV